MVKAVTIRPEPRAKVNGRKGTLVRGWQNAIEWQRSLAKNLEVLHESDGGGDPRDRGGAGLRVGGHRHGIGASQDRVPRPLRTQIALRFAAPLLGAFLVGGCAYWGEKQGELIFRPSKDAWWGFNGAGHAHDEHWIPVGADGQKLHAWWVKADDPNAPVILYLHGARWNLTGSVTRVDRWRKLGFNVFAIDYRGFGQSSDLVPSEASSYEDAEAAWEYLGRLAPGKQRLIVGHSLGGVIATELAVRHPEAAGLVLEATLTSVSDMVANTTWSFLPVDLVLTQRFDALKRIPEVKVPLMIVHGTRDTVVPFAMGEKLYAAATAPKQFVRVEGGSHHNLSAVAFDQYRAVMAQLFKLKS